MDEELAYFLSVFGAATQRAPAEPAVCRRYDGVLPKRLLDVWAQEGWSGYADGLFWIVNPDEFDAVLQMWLDDLGIGHIDRFHVIARTSFGALLVWGEKTGHSLVINPPMGFALAMTGQVEKVQAGQADQCVGRFFAFLTKKEADLEDESGKLLFQRARKKLGPITSDQMYGLEPAVPLGGTVELGNLRKVGMIEHLTLVTQVSEKHLIDSESFTEAARRHGLL